MKPELLAPVGDFETLAAAIKAGADSVYFGIKWINMRASSARNFDIKELPLVMKELHKHKLKGYLTLNTVIYDHEIPRVEKILDSVKKTGVDAVIATDMAIIQMCHERNIEVHVSTQLSVANYQSVKFFAQFSPRIVLARECTLEQIKQIKDKIKQDNLTYKGRQIELESFVHGSLCVAYSGRCFMSQYHNRLSANRGQCLQECRRRYKLTDIEDPRREFIVDGNYMMSPKDLCALPILGELIKSGIDVLKIEGRAKGPEYVYTVTKVYREALTLLEKNKFSKEEMIRLTKELDKVFNRGFSTNFYLGTPTNDSWNRFYGSSAQKKKVKLGKVIHYYSKLSVVSIKIEEHEIKENDLIGFIGPTTGYFATKVQGLRVDNKAVEMAGSGQEVSFKVQEKVRPEDRVYLIQERDIDKEEKRIQDQLQPIGIHTPFKQTKQKGMS